MNVCSAASFLTVCLICGQHCAIAGQGGEFPSLSAMRNDLVRLGAYAYVASPTSPKSAPHIHSQSWVDWLPATEVRRRMYEQEKRDFGMAFVGELEKCAEEQKCLEGYGDMERESWKMLRIAQWLKTSTGYGNFFLAHWAENLALNMVGKMAVSTEVNTNSVNRLLLQLGAGEADLRFRVAVLNDESPNAFSLPQTADADVAFNSLMREWGRGRSAAAAHYGPTALMRLSWRDVAEDNRAHAFYLDDSCSGELPLRELWKRKLHSAICSLAPEFYRMKVIRNVLKYRELVGPLPRPSQFQLTDKTAGAGYVETVDGRWSSRLLRKYGPNCSGLWALAICKGDFVDQWTAAYLRKED